MAVFWCAGMYASGSTWAYNVMRAIAAAAWPERAESGVFVNKAADLDGHDGGAGNLLVKSHDLARDAAERLLAMKPVIVATIRDPRDAITSLMIYQRYGYELAKETVTKSARFVGDIAAMSGALLLRYEDRFTENPDTVARIAAAMGATLDAATRAAIHARFRRDEVERFIADLPTLPGAHHDARSGDIFDPRTQWHKHHAGRTGEIGRWRMLLMPGQPADIEAGLADWFETFGYERAPLHMPGYGLSFGSFSVKL